MEVRFKSLGVTNSNSNTSMVSNWSLIMPTFFFFLREFISKKTLFEKLQYLKQEQ